MNSLRLYKKEKLCSLTAIDILFTRREGNVCTSFPLRAVWRINDKRTNKNAQFLASIPKKRFKHAVDRVKLRRRVREAYRLNRQHLSCDENIALDIAFIYIGSSIVKYDEIEKAMIKLLQKVSNALNSPEKETNYEKGV